MGTITISMDNKNEKLLRKIALKKYGKTKGAISKTIINYLNSDSTTKDWEEMLKIMKDIKINLRGKKAYESRNELYD